MHPALAPRRVAVVTGAATGIGLAAARRFASLGMRLVIADIDEASLKLAAAELVPLLAEGPDDLRTYALDVASRDDVQRLRDMTLAAFDDVGLLMNNAAIGKIGRPWQDAEVWRELLDVNVHGVLHGLEAFVPAMLAHGRPAAIVNVGSKQGITTPPGNAAYNVSKAAVKVITEQLAHELRQMPNALVTAHLLIPGFTYTNMVGRGTRFAEKPAAAWWPEQVVALLVESMAKGDFYVLCPDNEVDRATDEKRIAWAAGDVIENRPALSRWHPDYAAAFAASRPR